ncbi:hypothetical protein BJX61DRAFT_546033 [Aspergillus egyptiacus]|nr:hypothetical protein BJX61DRAFT_546033 [Aspergillus egyptiacus]
MTSRLFSERGLMSTTNGRHWFRNPPEYAVDGEISTGMQLHDGNEEHPFCQVDTRTDATSRPVAIMVPLVDVKRPLAQYGMDSMIGAEFRTCLYQDMAVDVLLVLLLSSACTLETLLDLALALFKNECVAVRLRVSGGLGVRGPVELM